MQYVYIYWQSPITNESLESFVQQLSTREPCLKQLIKLAVQSLQLHYKIQQGSSFCQ
jgi:hypothetical protein